MYDVEFEYAPIGGSSQILRMCYSTGYIIKTIDGLTGASVSMTTRQDNDGYGDIMTSSRYPSRQIVIKGRILDRQTALKQRLLEFFAPGRTVTMYINTKRFGSCTERYRKTTLIIKQSPVITQMKHSDFMLTALMPMPFFEGASEETITLTPNTTNSISVKGDIEPDFRLNVEISSGILYAAHLGVAKAGYANTNRSIDFEFDLSDIESLSAGDKLSVWRSQGMFHTLITKDGVTLTDDYSAISVSADMAKLLLGEQNCTFSRQPSGTDDASTAVFSKCEIVYTPIYTGVIIDGV